MKDHIYPEEHKQNTQKRVLRKLQMKQTEAEITRAIRGCLKSLGVFHWKNFGGPMSQKGVSDILGLWKGKLLAIEVKVPKRKATPDQQLFIDRVNREGGLAFVAYSIDDVIKQLGVQDRFSL